MRMPEGLIGKLKMLPKLAEMGAFFPKIVSKGPCQEVVKTDGFSLFDYPVLQCWPEDGGRFITLPLVFSRNPDTGKRNCGMYRMQVYDERTTGMHWQTHKQGAEHYRRMQQQGQHAHGRRRRHRRRPRHHVLRHPAPAARSRRDDDRRLPAPEPGRNGQVPDLRPRSARATPKSSSKATSNSANCAPRAPSATTPASTRWPTSTRSSTSPASPSARTPSTPPPSSARRPWRTTTWARPSSASSCR